MGQAWEWELQASSEPQPLVQQSSGEGSRLSLPLGAFQRGRGHSSPEGDQRGAQVGVQHERREGHLLVQGEQVWGLREMIRMGGRGHKSP